jgi:hypothetical protein
MAVLMQILGSKGGWGVGGKFAVAYEILTTRRNHREQISESQGCIKMSRHNSLCSDETQSPSREDSNSDTHFVRELTTCEE